MFVAHFAPSLLLTRFAPSTPLWALAFAGALPDLIFYALNILGLESGHTHSTPSTVDIYGIPFTSSPTNCLPYSASFPYSHSTPSHIFLALSFALFITVIYRLPIFSFAALSLALLSHLPLDMAISRNDSVVPDGAYQKPIWKRDASVPLLDYPWGTFTSDLGIFVFAILFHARTVYPPEEYQQTRGQPNVSAGTRPNVAAGEKRDMTLGYMGVIFLAAILQAHFSFWSGPIEEGDFATGGLFMLEILVLVGGLHWLEGYTRVERRVDEAKKTN